MTKDNVSVHTYVTSTDQIKDLLMINFKKNGVCVSVCMCAGTYMPWGVYGDRRMTYRGLFLPHTMWVQEIKLRFVWPGGKNLYQVTCITGPYFFILEMSSTSYFSSL